MVSGAQTPLGRSYWNGPSTGQSGKDPIPQGVTPQRHDLFGAWDQVIVQASPQELLLQEPEPLLQVLLQLLLVLRSS
jgi:hypothetical protein